MFKSLAKRGLLAFLLICSGLFLGFSAQAQSNPTTGATNSQLNWLTEQDAMATLKSTIDLLHQSMQGFTPGTSNYLSLYNHAAYYKAIYLELDNGATTPTAVVEGFSKTQFDTNGSPSLTASSQQNEQLRQAYFQDAVDLLTY